MLDDFVVHDDVVFDDLGVLVEDEPDEEVLERFGAGAADCADGAEATETAVTAESAEGIAGDDADAIASTAGTW